MVDGCYVLDDGLGARVVIQAEDCDERGVIVEADALDTLHFGGESLHHFVLLCVLYGYLWFYVVFCCGNVGAVLILRDERDVLVAGLQELGVQRVQVEFD